MQDALSSALRVDVSSRRLGATASDRQCSLVTMLATIEIRSRREMWRRANAGPSRIIGRWPRSSSKGSDDLGRAVHLRARRLDSREAREWVVADRHGKGDWRGPYSSVESVTMMIARQLRKETAERYERQTREKGHERPVNPSVQGRVPQKSAPETATDPDPRRQLCKRNLPAT
jgi:hypothetical protein